MKLNLELVPQSCWMSNVRSVVSKSRWDTIKSAVAAKAWNVCRICGDVGPKHPVECHEIWHYDDVKLIQKLTGMIALCPNCHMCKHFGFAQVSGKSEKALKHLMKTNELTRLTAEATVKRAFVVWAERSKKRWMLDISILNDYGIDVSKLKGRK